MGDVAEGILVDSGRMKENRACAIGLYKKIRDCGRIFGNLENLGRRVFINTQLGEDCRVWLSHKVNANEAKRDMRTLEFSATAHVIHTPPRSASGHFRGTYLFTPLLTLPLHS